jgi:predicted DNA-binding mobile mystery protein A
MSGAQLARRLGKTASQSIEDMQRSEREGSIKLETLDRLAKAMGCKLVYAIVPTKPLDEVRRDQALKVARRLIKRTAHNMKLEAQDLDATAERQALERVVERLLGGPSNRLWQ